jgi:5-methyltetrahydrofolate--homocysteine methyltransferase
MLNILDRLKRGDIIVGDGAFGTMLMQRGLKQGDPPEKINLAAPQILEEISALYLEAGAEIVTTNSFGGSSLRLQHFSLENDMERINRAAVEAARRAVGFRRSDGENVKTLRRYGPGRDIREFPRPNRRTDFQRNRYCLHRNHDRCSRSRTCRKGRPGDQYRNPRHGDRHIRQKRQRLPYPDGNIHPRNRRKAGCRRREHRRLQLREYMQYSSLPVAIQSNAGLPVQSDEKLIYPETPEFAAEKAAEMVKLGVRIIGGCCGTGPEHIRAIRRVVDAYAKTTNNPE